MLHLNWKVLGGLGAQLLWVKAQISCPAGSWPWEGLPPPPSSLCLLQDRPFQGPAFFRRPQFSRLRQCVRHTQKVLSSFICGTRDTKGLGPIDFSSCALVVLGLLPSSSSHSALMLLLLEGRPGPGSPPPLLMLAQESSRCPGRVRFPYSVCLCGSQPWISN